MAQTPTPYDAVLTRARAASRVGEAILVFTQDSGAAGETTEHLRVDGLTAACIVPGTAPDDRAAAMTALASGELDVLVLTNFMSIGWQAPQRVVAVLHMDCPAGPYRAQREGRLYVNRPHSDVPRAPKASPSTVRRGGRGHSPRPGHPARTTS